MTDTDPRLLGVVLCGGASKRMGRDKADLVMPDGRSFLDHACERLRRLCAEVCVSTSRKLETSYRRIDDPPESHGPISGIDASLRFAMRHGFEACLFTPVDTPFLTPIDLSRLADAFARNKNRIVCAVSDPSVSDRPGSDPSSPFAEPLIGIYPVMTVHAIGDAIQQRQYSLWRLLDTLNIVPVALSADACRNLNTPSDLNDLAKDT